MRHAKSSWENAEISDLERPLLEMGLKRTHLIIDYMQKKQCSIDMIISSHAVRAVETARLMAYAFNVDENRFSIEKQVYLSGESTLLDQLFDVPPQVHSVLVVAHNPSITNLANRYLKKKLDYLPTSGVVALQFKTDAWENVPLAPVSVKFSISPKEL